MSEKLHISLKGMAEAKLEGIQKATYFKVDPDMIEFEPGFNLREEGADLDSHIERIYQVMKAGADIPPIDVSVVDGKVIARDGHCRTRAARKMKADGIPYMLEARQFRGNEVDQTFHMIGTANGKALTPLEQGKGYLRLTKWGLTPVMIAERLGLHRNTVDNYLMLAEAPVELQRMVATEEVSVIVAIEAIRKHGTKAVEELKAVSTKVKEKGGKKVTMRHVSGPIVTKKVAVRFYEATSRIKSYIKTDELDDLVADDDDASVTIKAVDLKALLDAQAQCRNPDDEL